MITYSNHPSQAIERAQPWLGTLVSIRVEGLPCAAAHRAIDIAFQEVATVHRRMSFHEAGSDVGRLNREGAGQTIETHPYTYEVMQQAVRLSACSDGCFDVTVGAELVHWNLLPRPAGARDAFHGSWRDMELLPGNRIIFHRPLCVDLGGIAKGFAVDRATECLRAQGALRTVVNAGGDIRVQGEIAEPIRLSAVFPQDRTPILELIDGSVASSSGHLQRRWQDGRWCGPHVDGVRRAPASTDRFVCVVARQCMVADALTKVVMAQGPRSGHLLRKFGASAHMYGPGHGWQHIEATGSEAG